MVFVAMAHIFGGFKIGVTSAKRGVSACSPLLSPSTQLVFGVATSTLGSRSTRHKVSSDYCPSSVTNMPRSASVMRYGPCSDLVISQRRRRGGRWRAASTMVVILEPIMPKEVMTQADNARDDEFSGTSRKVEGHDCCQTLASQIREPRRKS